MTIPILQIPVAQPGPSPMGALLNSLSRGYRQGQLMHAQNEQNKMNALKLQQMPQMLKARQALLNAQLQGAQQTDQFAPQMNSARLQNMQQQNQMQKIKMQYLPQMQQQSLKNMQNNTSRFGAAYSFNKMLQSLPPAARAAFIREHPIEFNNALNAYGQSFAPQQGQPTTSQGLSPTVNRALELSANKDLTTGKTRTQQEGGAQVSNLVKSPQFQAGMNATAQYAGALGKGQAALDALNQNNPKAYTQYLNFKNVTIPLLANRIKTLDGMGTTDSQRKELSNMFNYMRNSLTTNPNRFKESMQQLLNTMQAVEGSVNASANPLYNVSRSNPNNTPKQAPSLQVSSNGKVLVINAQGQRGYIPASQLQNALSQGYKRG